MTVTYDSLHNNRLALQRDCKLIEENIDEYKGKLVYINYDVGTGKTFALSSIIPSLIRNGNKVAILVYSYDIASEWERNILSCGIESTTKLYKVCSPSHSFFKDFHIRDCQKHTSRYKNYNFYRKICKKCTEPNYECYINVLKKIREADIVITSHAYFKAHMTDFSLFSVVIIDEIAGIDDHVTLSAAEISAGIDYLSKTKNTQSIPLLNKLYKCLQKDYKTAVQNNGQDNYSPYSTDRLDQENSATDENIAYLMRLAAGGIKNKNRLPNYLKKIITLASSTNNDIYLKSIPHFFGHDKKFKPIGDAVSAEFIARDYFILPEGNSTVTPAYIVLSAINTKNFIANIFQRKVDVVFGEGNINNNFNVIETSYFREYTIKKDNEKTEERKTKGYASYYHTFDHTQQRLDAYIKQFIQLHYGKGGIVIGGQKNWLTVTRAEKKTKNVQYTITHNNKDVVVELVSYKRYLQLQRREHIPKKEKVVYVPYIHFGMGGSNTFADFRAILIIHRYGCNQQIKQLYTADSKKIKFPLSNEEFIFNKNVATVRQLEGRILRPSKVSPIKYIDRRMMYDVESADNINRENTRQFPKYEKPYLSFRELESYTNYCNNEYEKWGAAKMNKVMSNINSEIFSSLLDPILKDHYAKKYGPSGPLPNKAEIERKYWTFTTTKLIEFMLPQICGKARNHQFERELLATFCRKHLIGHHKYDHTIVHAVYYSLFENLKYLNSYLHE